MKIRQLTSDSYLKLALLLASLVSLSPLAIDSSLAALPVMQADLSTSGFVIDLTITLYFFGLAIGNFFGAPLSDSFGRKPVALFGVALYSLSAFVIGLSAHIEIILFLRIFQALGAGFATVTSNVIIRDWYEGKEVAKLVTITGMIMMIMPLAAPIIGSLLLHYFDWQAIFYFSSILAVLVFFLFFIFVPESKEKGTISNKISKQQLFEKYKLFFACKQSVFYLFAVSLSATGMFVFLVSISFVYMDYFAISSDDFPLYFGVNVSLNILFSLFNTRLLKSYSPKQLLRFGILLQLLSGFLILYTVTQNVVSLMYLLVFLALYIGSLAFVFGNGAAIILNYKPELSASANATIGITRFVFGAIIGSFVSMITTDSLLPVALSMLLCACLAYLFYLLAEREVKKNALRKTDLTHITV